MAGAAVRGTGGLGMQCCQELHRRGSFQSHEVLYRGSGGGGQGSAGLRRAVLATPLIYGLLIKTAMKRRYRTVDVDG